MDLAICKGSDQFSINSSINFCGPVEKETEPHNPTSPPPWLGPPTTTLTSTEKPCDQNLFLSLSPFLFVPLFLSCHDSCVSHFHILGHDAPYTVTQKHTFKWCLIKHHTRLKMELIACTIFFLFYVNCYFSNLIVITDLSSVYEWDSRLL